MYNKYCTVRIFDPKTGESTHDAVTYENPDISPDAKRKCVERARFLRKHKPGKIYEPMIVQSIEEDKFPE